MAHRPDSAMPRPAALSRPVFALALAAAVCLPAGLASAAGNGGAGGDALAPKKLISGPSLLETGKVSPAKLEGDPSAKAVRPAPALPQRPEPKVSTSDVANPTRPAPPVKVALPRPVQQQVTEHLHELNACRVQVARDKHVPPAQIPAGAVLLRWTIGGDGTVSGAEVVEKTPVDPAVLECAQRTMTTWKFPVPDRGPLPVERNYRFHAGK